MQQLNAREVAEARRLELDGLFQKNKGAVTPADVVAFASNKQTYLHSLFDWDDTEAARKYREIQAAAYIRAVVRVEQSPSGVEVTVRAYVSLQQDRGDNGYRRLEHVLANAAMREALLNQALTDYRAFKNKYQALKELGDVWVAMDRVMDAACNPASKFVAVGT